MFVPFDLLPDTARIWIFQANRKFSEEERAIISNQLKLYTEAWAAHGTPLRSSFSLPFDHFIVLGVDENVHTPSGCSIDSIMRSLQSLSHAVTIDFFDRSKVAFKMDEEIVCMPLTALRAAFSDGKLTPQSLFFNNLIAAKEELDARWIIPVSDSWIKRYLPAEKFADQPMSKE